MQYNNIVLLNYALTLYYSAAADIYSTIAKAPYMASITLRYVLLIITEEEDDGDFCINHRRHWQTPLAKCKLLEFLSLPEHGTLLGMFPYCSRCAAYTRLYALHCCINSLLIIVLMVHNDMTSKCLQAMAISHCILNNSRKCIHHFALILEVPIGQWLSNAVA